jgi:membrane fusion protein (multidrug efflux system)
VVRLADALDPATRTMRVEVEPDQGSKLLRAGQYGSVTITLANYPRALLLPTSTLLTSQEKPAVFVVKDGRARRQALEIGINDGVRMQVTGGLKGDEQVVSDGKDSVREGEAVEVVR